MDGSAAGKDSLPSGAWYINGLAIYNGKAIFDSREVPHGSVLWEIDGIVAGTRQSTSVTWDNAFSNPDNLTALGSDLYFTAYSEQYGREMCVHSSGGAAGQLVGQPTISDVRNDPSPCMR